MKDEIAWTDFVSVDPPMSNDSVVHVLKFSINYVRGDCSSVKVQSRIDIEILGGNNGPIDSVAEAASWRGANPFVPLDAAGAAST